MTPAEEMLSRYAEWLMDTLRDLNSAIFVMQEIPDWQRKFADAKANSLLNEKMDRVADLSRALVVHALANEEETPEFRALIDRLRRALHEPIQ